MKQAQQSKAERQKENFKSNSTKERPERITKKGQRKQKRAQKEHLKSAWDQGNNEKN